MGISGSCKRAVRYSRYLEALQTVHTEQARLLNFRVGLPAFMIATAIHFANGGWIWGQLSLIFLTLTACFCAKLPYSTTEGTNLEAKDELDKDVRSDIKNFVFSTKKVISKSYVAYSGMSILWLTVVLSGT